MINLEDMFVDPSEKMIATLGSGYLSNLLSTGTVDKGVCIVSDKRVYFRGKCYFRERGHYKALSEERTVDLKDISGTGFIRKKDYMFLVLFFLSLALGLFMAFQFFTLIGLDDYDEGLSFVYFGSMIFLGLVSICTFIIYIVKKIKLFEISFAGGGIAFKASSYSENEMQEFQKQLRLAKDNYLARDKSVTTVTYAEKETYHAADELIKYKQLLDANAITQEEYGTLKSKVISK